MEAVKGDFTGFTFRVDGVTTEETEHSSQLGFVRVSNGDRYDETLYPEINDKTVEVPGMDGNYYFGSDYGVKNIEIQIAYDFLTEEQLRNIRKIYGQKQIGELIFDERPYKKYLVKLESPIELSYVCFDEAEQVEESFNGIYGPTKVMRPTGNTVRVYKGEGTISFVAYYPFAKSEFKFLTSTDEGSDWAVSSGILSSAQYASIDKCIMDGAIGEITIYNPGDIETGFRLYCPFDGSKDSLTLSYVPHVGKESTGALNISGITKKGEDVGFIINTDTQLIQGVAEYRIDGYITSNNIYNEYIDSGFFFKIDTSNLSQNTLDTGTITVGGSLASNVIDIYYDYLYF